MCGILGVLGPVGHADSREAGHALHHRGPDASGEWEDDDVRLVHRRLAIVGLGQSGDQPMLSSSGRHVLAFNGEIYNFRDLRHDLESRAAIWRGTSDSEVLVEAIEAYGIEAALRRVAGMFAFAVWDRQQRCLTLARDRVGEKPLYYANDSGGFAFASELSALETLLPDRRGPAGVSREGLDDLLAYGSTRGRRSIREGVHKLPPATFLSIEADRLETDDAPRRYWSLGRSTGGLGRRLDMSDAEGIRLIDDALKAAVRQQMVADVPLGAFLSGGIDSSLIVAKMVEASPHARDRIRTFSIGFESTDHDEAPFARAVAEHLGTDHTERYVTDDDLLELAPTLPFVGGEPFADPSLLPTLLVCALAREHVTVALSGDGADELFAGYDRYSLALRLERIPRPLRRLIGLGITALDRPTLWGAVEQRSRSGRRPGEHKWDLTSSRLRALRGALTGHSPEDRYHGLLRSPTAGPLVRTARPTPGTAVSDPTGSLAVEHSWGAASHLDAMLLDDLQGYLVDDILVKVDRAAMHVSLETRMPFLDHRVVEAAWTLPHHLLVRDGRRKWVLREILAQHLPPALTERPKAGFGVPLARWLRGPLRPWAEELLAQSALDEHGLLETEEVRRLWHEHVQRRIDRSRELWPVLMFQGWMAGEPPPSPGATRAAGPP